MCWHFSGKCYNELSCKAPGNYSASIWFWISNLLMGEQETLISMISGILDVSPAAETNDLHLSLGPQDKSRKSLEHFLEFPKKAMLEKMGTEKSWTSVKWNLKKWIWNQNLSKHMKWKCGRSEKLFICRYGNPMPRSLVSEFYCFMTMSKTELRVEMWSDIGESQNRCNLSPSSGKLLLRK